MATFKPPTDDFVTPVPYTPSTEEGLISREQKLQNNLAKFFPSTPRGRNVWWLNDGTFTENDPGIDNYQRVFYGGHDNEITAEEQAALTAAGYGAYIT